MPFKLVATILLGASSLVAQCNTEREIRTLSPWQASFFYASGSSHWGAGIANTLNQFVDVTVAAPLTVNTMYSTSYDQAAGLTTPLDQVGNVAEVRIYTHPLTHDAAEASMVGWTHVTTAELTIVAFEGDCTIQNFKDPVSGLPTPFVLPAGSHGLCLECIPTSWVGTTALPQTNVPLLNPDGLTCLAFVPPIHGGTMASDQFLELSGGAIQTRGWQQVSSGALVPNSPNPFVLPAQPNLGFNYTPHASAARSETVGDGCYDKPFMLYEKIPGGTNPIDLVGQSYTADLDASPIGSFYSITNGGIPYAAPPVGATNLTLGGTAPAPPSNVSGLLRTSTWNHTLATPLQVPAPGGSLMATELGINANGKVYFSTVASANTSSEYNFPRWGALDSFRDLEPQWAVFNASLDPAIGVGDIYVMEPSPNLGGVMIWWHSLQNWGGSAPNSFSIEFTPNGSSCNIAYGSSLANETYTSSLTNDAIVGFSAGGGERVSAPIDWSGIPAAPDAQQSGDGSLPPTMNLAARPISGTTVDLVLSDLPAAAAPGVARFGLFVINTVGLPGVDLGSIGMPGCSLFVGGSPLMVLGMEDVANTPGDIKLPFAMPAGFDGTALYLQGAAIHAAPSLNALGMTLSKAVCLTLGSI